jgi:hypothetical protein
MAPVVTPLRQYQSADTAEVHVGWRGRHDHQQAGGVLELAGDEHLSADLHM